MDSKIQTTWQNLCPTIKTAIISKLSRKSRGRERSHHLQLPLLTFSNNFLKCCRKKLGSQILYWSASHNIGKQMTMMRICRSMSNKLSLSYCCLSGAKSSKRKMRSTYPNSTLCYNSWSADISSSISKDQTNRFVRSGRLKTRSILSWWLCWRVWRSKWR